LQALADRRADEHEAALKRAGLIAASIFNSKRQKKSDKIWRPEDFIRTKGDRETHDDDRRMTPEEAREMFEGWAAATGGAVRVERKAMN
jgi:hypothetical protein